MLVWYAWWLGEFRMFSTLIKVTLDHVKQCWEYFNTSLLVISGHEARNPASSVLQNMERVGL